LFPFLSFGSVLFRETKKMHTTIVFFSSSGFLSVKIASLFYHQNAFNYETLLSIRTAPAAMME